eukprot:gene31964-33890_t
MALAAASSTARGFQVELQHVYAPLIALSSLVNLEQNWVKLDHIFQLVAAELFDQVSMHGMLEIQFAPLGIITESYPADPDASNHDLFEEPTRRAIALETVALGSLTLAGPFPLFRGPAGLVAWMPIYVDDVDADDVCLKKMGGVGTTGKCFFGMNRSVHLCDACYNATSRRKFWGFSIAIIVWEAFTGEGSQLENLYEKGYLYKLQAADPNHPDRLKIIATSPEPPHASLKDSEFVETSIDIRGPTPSELLTKKIAKLVIADPDYDNFELPSKGVSGSRSLESTGGGVRAPAPSPAFGNGLGIVIGDGIHKVMPRASISPSMAQNMTRAVPTLPIIDEENARDTEDKMTLV